MKLSLNLQQKGLLLVAFPLLAELGFIGHLVHLQQQSEQAAERVAHSKAICISAENVIRNSYDSASAFVLFLVSKTPEYASRYETVTAKIKAQLKDLSQLVGTDPVQVQNYQKLDHEASETIDVMETIKKTMESPEGIHNSIEVAFLRRKVHQHLNLLFSASSAITEQEEHKNDLLTPLAKTAKEAEQHWLWLGVILNILVTCLAAIFFSRDITHRVGKIVNNAISLVNGNPLSAPLGGGDEISELDQVLHTAGKLLQEASRRESAIINNVQEAICSVNASFIFSRVSPAATKLWGYDDSELLGKRVLNLLPESAQKNFFDTMSGATKGEPSVKFEIEMKRKDESLVWVSWSGYWSASEQEFFCVAQDIDERKKLEQMKQDFVSMISHDLRSPLTAVNAFFHMLSVGTYGELSPKGTSMSKKVETSLTGVVRLLNDLLDVEKLESGLMQLRQEKTPVSSIIKDALDMVRPLAEQQKIGLELIAREDSTLMADASRLSQVVQNLLSNAVKFSPQGTSIQLFYGIDKTGQAEIRVTDRGPGISASDKELVFDRFRQLSNSNGIAVKGSGLGLAICKAIVEQHGGTVGVDSQLGMGSSFWVKLPAEVNIKHLAKTRMDA
jgi:PAS domain S-box-containing protein